jgi:hypothetical protein
MWPRSRRAYNIRPEELIEEEDWEFEYGLSFGIVPYRQRASAKQQQDVTRAAKRIVKLMKELGH